MRYADIVWSLLADSQVGIADHGILTAVTDRHKVLENACFLEVGDSQ